MRRDLMARQLSHGPIGGCWSGIQHAQTLWLTHVSTAVTGAGAVAEKSE